MESTKRISGMDELDMALLATGNFETIIGEDNGAEIHIKIVSSPGGSMEGGFEQTTISAKVPGLDDFRFAIHPQDFLYEIAKFFGAEDVTTGFADFDKAVIVKTNNAARISDIFSEEIVRDIFRDLSGYSFSLKDYSESGALLELNVQRALTDPQELLKMYVAFLYVLRKISYL